jgi:hypothetical protein
MRPAMGVYDAPDPHGRSRYEMPTIEKLESEVNDSEVSLKGYDILTCPADFIVASLCLRPREVKGFK